MKAVFPSTLVFNGYAAPVRIEGDSSDLEVIGNIPDELDGFYIRNSADHQFPPLHENDLFLNGDGMLHQVRIHAGKGRPLRVWDTSMRRPRNSITGTRGLTPPRKNRCSFSGVRMPSRAKAG